MKRIISKENHCKSISGYMFSFFCVNVASVMALKQFLASSQTARLQEAAITCCPAATCSTEHSETSGTWRDLAALCKPSEQTPNHREREREREREKREK